MSEQRTLLCEQKNVNQSSDFPVRRTGSYRHKKALLLSMSVFALSFFCFTPSSCRFRAVD